MIFFRPTRAVLMVATLLTLNNFGYSQLTKMPVVLSSEVATLGKYGTYDVNYNTGSPNITVPIYSLKTSFIPIDIYLNYDSKGFMPNESGYDVGKNWNIIAGGAITRIVKGEPDDKYNSQPLFQPGTNELMQCDKKGFIYGLTTTGTTYTTSFINNLSNYINLTSWSTNERNNMAYPVYSLYYEQEPDIFTFSMLGYSGKFFMANDGSIKVISDKKFKVDISQLGNRYDFKLMIQNIGISNFNSTLVSTIKLTADDGTEFTFGGTLKDIEMSFDGNEGSYGPTTGLVQNSGVVTAWYLVKVKNKDGREINFINDNFQEVSGTTPGLRKDQTMLFYMFDGNAGVTEGTHYSPFYEIKLRFNRYSTADNCGGGASLSDVSDVKISRSVVKKCYLKKIVTELEEVEFNYTKNQRFYTTDNPDWNGNLAAIVAVNKPMCSQRLSSINIKDKKMQGVSIANNQAQQSSPISKTIFLNYSFIRNYLYLVSLNNDGVVSQFVYDRANQLDLPQPMTYGIDYLGFYNGENSNTGFIGGISLSTLFNVHYPAGVREPNSLYSTIGMLKEIIHPTGGKTVFELENHYVGKWLEKTTQSPIIPVVTNYTGLGKLVPGLRIKTIQNIPGETVEFKYVTNWEQQVGMVSSGILNYSNATGYNFEQAGNANFYSRVLEENNLVQSSTYFEYPVSYSEVIKKYNQGFEKLKFSDILTNPDKLNAATTSFFRTLEFSNTNFIGQMNKIYYRTSSSETERGKLIESSVYDNSNSLKRRSQISYNTDPLRLQYFGTGLIKPGLSPICISSLGLSKVGLGVINVYENFYYHNLPTKEIVTDYSMLPGAQPLITTTEYQYISNVNPLLRKKKVYTSAGDTKEFSYLYAEDIPSSQSPIVITSMIQKNMTGNILEEQITKNGTSLLKKNIFIYSIVSGVPQLAEEKTVNGLIAPNEILPILSITKYTPKGNISESTLPNNIPISYKWEYDDSKMVAKIQNALETDGRFTSFENSVSTSNTLTEWQFNNLSRVNDYLSVTGRSYYNLLNSPVSASNLDASKTYNLSYWKKDDAGISITGGSFVNITSKPGINGWTLIEGQLLGTSSVQISGNAKIDELRLHPVGSFATSYTYEALVGLTSICDVNNNITYYHYDDRGRLSIIKDQDKNILKRYCYNYWSELIDCSAPCDPGIPIWQNTTEVRCQTIGCSTTGYQEVKQVNVSPCAPPGQEQWVATYNPSACPVTDMVQITYQSFTTGYTATYTSSTGQVYTFVVPSGIGTLGCIPNGRYTLSIQPTAMGIIAIFDNGCTTVSGTSAIFSIRNLFFCNKVDINADYF